MNKNVTISLVVIIVLGLAYWGYQASREEEVETVPEVPATVSTIMVAPDTSSASAISAGAKTIRWQTANYPREAGVNINLIREVSVSPRSFELVRVLATDTANDGIETWIPMEGETGDNLYIEVTCSGSYQFTASCSLATEPIKVE